LLHHGEMTTDRPIHRPVLLREVLELLDPQPGDRVLDATVGLAGHAVELLKAVGSQGFLIGLDVDDANLEVARSVLRKVGENFILIRANFRDVRRALTEAGQGPVQRILADFGPSSNQFDAPGRGLSFQHDGPLDMRLDSRLPTTAADLVNRLSEHELSDLIYSNSQERFSRRIARQICRDRRDKRLTRTSELVGTVCRALKVSPTSHREKIHPATRVFQALRIAVNAELDAIAEFLPQIPALVTPGGRIAAISFHSLEDRLVKRAFRESKQQNIYTLVTKQPVITDRQERQANPRSRSAKLRVAERTDQPIGT
jgi:16S rRNA (cytosine1402-N4)-methyltransferase